MQSSQTPAVIPLPFANSGGKNTIPTASQISVTPGKASYTDGYPPLTGQPLASGGVPPSREDTNGILYAITAVQQWQCAGGIFRYDSTFSSQNSGYPRGAILISTDGITRWLNMTDNNTTNPDGASPANWQSLGNAGFSGIFGTNGYRKLPDGTIIQWGGSISQSGAGGTTVNFPIAFPSACLSIIANCSGATSGSNFPVVTTGMQNQNNFTFFASVTPTTPGSNVSNQGIIWNAIGY